MQKSGAETASPFSLPCSKPPVHKYITIIKEKPKPSSWPQIPCAISVAWAETPSANRKSTIENALRALASASAHRVTTQKQKPLCPG